MGWGLVDAARNTWENLVMPCLGFWAFGKHLPALHFWKRLGTKQSPICSDLDATIYAPKWKTRLEVGFDLDFGCTGSFVWYFEKASNKMVLLFHVEASALAEVRLSGSLCKASLQGNRRWTTTVFPSSPKFTDLTWGRAQIQNMIQSFPR